MCGLAGKLNFDNSPIAEGLIEQMCAVLRHRGPDDQGIYLSPKKNIGLGHRRLAIIDLSSAGHQPMSNEDGSCWIIFNGEIYNFQKLRDDLIKKGHRFHSQTDTETILHLYEDYGEDCLKYLRGMFAFAIWDEKQQKLFLARDRVGQRPLNYYYNKRCLIFASEIGALLQDPAVDRNINYQALDYYLGLQYVPAPWTIFQNIKKLPAAHYLVWQNQQLTIKRYWNLRFFPKIDLPEREVAKVVREKLSEAVKLQLISDAPLGIFLSGGLDSSAVVALASAYSKNLQTFTVGFEGHQCDELPKARIISQKFQTQHHEFLVKPQAAELLPLLVRYCGEPFADPSLLPSYYVSRESAQKIKVALNGDGGDENFAGYQRYAILSWARNFQTMPYFLRRKIIPNLVKTIGCFYSGNLSYKLKTLSRILEKDDLLEQYLILANFFYFSPQQREQLYTQDFKGLLANSHDFENIMSEIGYLKSVFIEPEKSADFMDSILQLSVNTFLPDCLLFKADMAAMANSLEGRSPFLDHEFMEFCARIPWQMKIKGRQTKIILKKALAGDLPLEILRQKKQGFDLPLDSWFRDELKNFASEILLDQRTTQRNIFQKIAVSSLLQEHFSGKNNHGERIWALIFLELWFREFVD